jgi:hypothetical protein
MRSSQRSPLPVKVTFFLCAAEGAKLMTDPRANELLELAASEGFILPMPVRLILWLEDHDCIVDLASGIASRPTVGTPSPSGKAVAYLLQDVDGEFAL